MNFLRIFFSLTFVFLTLLASNNLVLAAEGDATASGIFSCGLANVEGSQQCCKPTDLVADGQQAFNETPNKPKIPFLDTAVNVGLGFMKRQVPIDSLGNNTQECFVGNADSTSGECVCKLLFDSSQEKQIRELNGMCSNKFRGNQADIDTCQKCGNGSTLGTPGLLTGIGCVPLELGKFVGIFVLQIGIGFAGVAAFAVFIISAIQMQLSGGDPKRIQSAQQQMTSAIAGLVLIIFSVFLLRFIGITILQIPGLQ